MTIAGLVCGVLGIGGFVFHELGLTEPLLDIRAFRNRRLSSGSTTLIVLFAVQGGVFVVLFPFFEAVLGWSPIRSLLGLLPMLVVMMSASGMAAKISKRLHARATMLGGVAVASAGLGLMAARVSVTGGYLSILPGMLIIGLGTGLTMPLGTEAITSSLPADRQGVASALNDVTRELGGALGVALLGAVLTAGYRSAITPALDSFPQRIADAANTGIGRAIGVAAELHSKPRADALLDAARRAFVDGWSTSMWIGSAAMGLLFIFLRLRAPSHAASPLHDPDLGGTT